MRLQLGLITAILLSAAPATASIDIEDYTFDLDQFTGAAVTYRANADGGTVTFDGKLWDNYAGVDGFTPGELAAGQFGSDPGDQLSLNKRSSPDWFELNYAGAGLTIGASDEDTFVVYEITSSSSGVDTEGTSWRISFNGGAFINASAGSVKFIDVKADNSSIENVNQIAFDLKSFGFVTGDKLDTIRIENLDSGSSTSDPDFIFTALGSARAIPEPTSLIVWGLLGAAVLKRRRS